MMAPTLASHYECGRCNNQIGLFSMPQSPIPDPLTWRAVTAPSLVDFEILANEVYCGLPKEFRILCADLVIRIEVPHRRNPRRDGARQSV
jgi:hypothetical protein